MIEVGVVFGVVKEDSVVCVIPDDVYLSVVDAGVAVAVVSEIVGSFVVG